MHVICPHSTTVVEQGYTDEDVTSQVYPHKLFCSTLSNVFAINQKYFISKRPEIIQYFGKYLKFAFLSSL
jgi:hypothetical protein